MLDKVYYYNINVLFALEVYFLYLQLPLVVQFFHFLQQVQNLQLVHVVLGLLGFHLYLVVPIIMDDKINKCIK